MDPDRPLVLLGGLSPQQFMHRYWQKKPLLVRRALPDVVPPVSRAALFALAASDAVESRLVVREGDGWRLRHGPLPRRALPPLKQRGWTVLVQGLDLHLRAAHDLLARFRFVPDARLDDLMLSWASDGGGVGPHLDSYDVFLLQVAGRRRWRIGRARDRSLVEGLPLKILRRFEPEHDWVLEPGDLLYLPPQWAHDGVAEGECMTASVGFRAPTASELARDLLLHLADGLEGGAGETCYADPQQPATARPGAIPPALRDFAQRALQRVTTDRVALDRALGEMLSEPKPQVWFEPAAACGLDRGLRLDPRTRMIYDMHQAFINGEAIVVRGRDATLLRRLADRRGLSAAELSRASVALRSMLAGWVGAGWLRADDDGHE